jgi:hypothetical protein
MPKLFDLDVSPDVFAANAHLATPPKLPKTDVEKLILSEKRKELVRRFDSLWVRCGGDPDFWRTDYQFDNLDGRDWHIDRYNVEYKIGVEIHGGQWAKDGKSGHRNPAGFQRDWEKVLRCAELGVLLIGLTTAMVTPGHVDRVVAVVRRRIEGI